MLKAEIGLKLVPFYLTVSHIMNSQEKFVKEIENVTPVNT